MSELDRLARELDAALAALGAPPTEDGSRAEWTSRRITLESAFFLLGWAQLEATVNEAARRLIDRRRRSPARADRLGFDIYEPGRLHRDLPLLRRAGLVIDPSVPAYADLAVLYEQRNALAHGRVAVDAVIAIEDVFGRLRAIAEAIETEARS